MYRANLFFMVWVGGWVGAHMCALWRCSWQCFSLDCVGWSVLPSASLSHIHRAKMNVHAHVLRHRQRQQCRTVEIPAEIMKQNQVGLKVWEISEKEMGWILASSLLCNYQENRRNEMSRVSNWRAELTSFIFVFLFKGTQLDSLQITNNWKQC